VLACLFASLFAKGRSGVNQMQFTLANSQLWHGTPFSMPPAAPPTFILRVNGNGN